MLRRTLAPLGVAAALALASPAHAFTLDFIALAAGNEMALVTAGERTFTNIDGSGIDVEVLARALADNGGVYTGAPFGYLDDLSGGNPGGLGVCPQDDPFCAGSPEDNISGDEVAILEFSTEVEIISVTFWNGGHQQVWDANADIGIHLGNGDPVTAETFSDIFNATGVLNNIGHSTRFSFVSPEGFVGAGTGDDWKIYVSVIEFEEFTDIPEPGATILLGLGLAGLAFQGRRRS